MLVLFTVALLMSGSHSLRASLHLQPTYGCLEQGFGLPHLTRFIIMFHYGSSFSPKDALTTHSPSAPPLPLLRRQLPLPAGSRPAKGRPPIRLVPSPHWQRAASPCRRPIVGPHCGHRATSGCARERLRPLAGVTDLPFRLARPATHGQAAAKAPCKGVENRFPTQIKSSCKRLRS
ncbi:hypothetical protein BHE74_00047062 [Ensete ventricosum]|nr:hypothetical protein BHE74_00047062 [Ensete ventricosum]